MSLVVNATFAVLSDVEVRPGVSIDSDRFDMIDEPTTGANFFAGEKSYVRLATRKTYLKYILGTQFVHNVLYLASNCQKDR